MDYSFILSGVFILLMMFLGFIDQKTFKKPPHQNYKNIIISIGVLGTFVGILIGLWHFDTGDIEGSVPTLLEGLKTAFITSVFGMLIAILLSALQKKKTSQQESKDENDALEALKNMSSAIKTGFENSDKTLKSFKNSFDSTQNSNKLISEKLNVLSDIYRANENIEKQLFSINAFSSHFERIDEDIHTLLEMVLKEAIHLKINEDGEYWTDIFRRMKEIVEELKESEMKIESLKSDVESKNIRIMELQQEITTFKEIISDFKKDENETVKSLEIKVFDLNKTIEDLESEVKKLEKTCKQKDELLLNYQPQIDKGNFIQPEMVKVKKGIFTMGSNSGKSDKTPVHKVEINYNFYVAKYPVTFEEYDRFCEKTNRKKPSDKNWGRDKRPVINISWHDAKAYTEWISKESGEKYRLPSESEWEYFTRSGTETNWFFGDDLNELDEYANCGEKIGRTTEVGSFRANNWEIYDTYGNIWEWCEDWYVDNYTKKPKDGKAYTEKNTSKKVMRGSAWDTPAGYSRSANRGWNYPQRAEFNIGFRIVKEIFN
jgi:formylglycine-generating enzyme required for sulfatase activity/preprotein translocase subunit SecG